MYSLVALFILQAAVVVTSVTVTDVTQEESGTATGSELRKMLYGNYSMALELSRQLEVGGVHGNSFSFERLPEYVEDLSRIDSGILFLGQANSIGTFHVVLASASISHCDYEVVKICEHGDMIYKLYTYKDPTGTVNESACKIPGSRVDESGSIIWTELSYKHSELPSTVCNSNARGQRMLTISMSPPGEEVFLTNLGMKINISPLIFTPENATSIFIREDFVSCSSRHFASGRKLLTTSCNIGLEEDDVTHVKLVHVTLLGAGDISVVSDKFVLNEYCQQDCSFPLGESTYVSVTCPNGYQHRLEVTKTFDESCPGAAIPFIGWFGIFLCRGSDRPTTFFFMVVWIVFGYFIIQLVILLFIWTMNLMNYLIGKSLSIVDEELGVCPVCKTPYLCKELVKNHLNCSKGICAYCKKPFPIAKLPEHCQNCPKYDAVKHNCLIKSRNPDGRLRQFTLWFELILYYKMVTQSIYVVILLILLVVVISPVRGEETNITEVELNLKKVFGVNNKEIFYHDEDILNFDKVFAVESFICGEGCWNGPNECRCPVDDYKNLTGPYLDNEVDDLKAIVIKEEGPGGEEYDHVEFESDDTNHEFKRKKRDLTQNGTLPNGEIIYRHPRHHMRLESAPVQFSNGRPRDDPYKAEPCTTCHISDRAFIEMSTRLSGKVSKSHSSLQALETIQTEWGKIEINDNIKSTFDETNLEVEWQTVRLEKDTVKVKGTVIGKLNIGHLSGITWSIKNKDSDEKKSLTLFIYDAVQRYQGNIKTVTGSRYLYTWFRGACTGDCPRNCACNSGTCFHKMFNYDRKWTCNPGWCWTINGGCSCCAVDIKSTIPRWIIVKHAISYLNTNLIFCLKLGTDKLHCDTTLDNKKITFEGVSVTVSKPYGEIKHLPDEVSAVYYNPRQETVQLLNPDYMWTSDDVCTSSCNHGVVGDLTANSVVNFGTSEGLSSTKRTMSWTGMEIEHTCHTGSWPDCNYYNIFYDIDKYIKNTNDTATHMSTDFETKYAYTKQSGIVMGVLPRRMSGMIDFTIQMNDVSLRRKENPLKISRFVLGSCSGCYGCTAGFECVGEATVEKHGVFSVHLESKNKFVNIDQTSRTLNCTSKLAVKFPIHAISLLNETEVEFCIKETMTCAKATVKLDKPVKKLQRRETIISIKSNDDLNQDKCTGTGWFGCLYNNAKNFFSNIWDWVSYAFKNYTIILSIVIPIVLVILIIFVTYKVMKRCSENRKYKGKGRDTHALLEKIKEEEREKENMKDKGIIKRSLYKMGMSK